MQTLICTFVWGIRANVHTCAPSLVALSNGNIDAVPWRACVHRVVVIFSLKFSCVILREKFEREGDFVVASSLGVIFLVLLLPLRS